MLVYTRQLEGTTHNGVTEYITELRERNALLVAALLTCRAERNNPNAVVDIVRKALEDNLRIIKYGKEDKARTEKNSREGTKGAQED